METDVFAECLQSADHNEQIPHTFLFCVQGAALIAGKSNLLLKRGSVIFCVAFDQSVISVLCFEKKRQKKLRFSSSGDGKTAGKPPNKEA